MPRDGSGTYTLPFPPVVTNTTISSAVENGTDADIAQDLNTPRPLVAGGTGASTPDGALDSLSAEKFKQVVSNWDATAWRAGSYYAAATATGTAPVSGHAFAGTVYYANASDFVLHATDLTDPINPVAYTRVMAAGVWSPWTRTGNTGTSGSQIGEFLFDTGITFPPTAGTVRFNNATQNSTTELFFSHLTATGVDITTSLPFVLRNGYDVAIADKADITKYKTFTITANPVLSGSDIRVLARLRRAGADLTALHVLVNANNGFGLKNRNYVTNGAMMVSQENAANVLTVTNAAVVFPVDMFGVYGSNAGTATTQQSTTYTSGGSVNRLRINVTGLDASVGTADQLQISHKIEGLRSQDLFFGAPQAKTITIRFGCKGPAGTYCISVQNGAANRSYVSEYVIAAGEANTDVYKSVTVPGDVTGTWAYDNTTGINITWALMSGTTYQQPANVWGTMPNAMASANQSNFMNTNGNVFELFDVGLYEGNDAPLYVVSDYASELALCQRYFYAVGFLGIGLSATAFTCGGSIDFPVTMRAAPTLSSQNFAVNTGPVGVPASFGATQNGFGVFNGSGNWTIGAQVSFGYFANARL
jgi:hypothetical protein